jgi:hypothetical protein
MGQVSKYLRKTSEGYAHWCPGCKEMHKLPDSWSFNGNVDCPTFSPSFKHEGLKTVRDENGIWTGEWVLDAQGNGIPEVCHYILTDGVLNFCSDSDHELKGKSVPLPELPKYHQDSETSYIENGCDHEMAPEPGCANCDLWVKLHNKGDSNG